MQSFCTIISSDYAHYALALFDSLQKFSEVRLEVLCIDRKEDIRGKYELPSSFKLHYLDAVTFDKTGQAIINKYATEQDKLRWSLKSVWLRHMLTVRGYHTAIYVDPDIFFFQNPGFLFDQLNTASLLLSPHWRCSDPGRDPRNFELNFRDGIYNGGFLGSSWSGLPALVWHAEVCLYQCAKVPERGFYYDQRYLDLLHSRFEGIFVIKHKGCNVANWNLVDCERVQIGHEVLINGVDPVVFIHFTRSTIRGIQKGDDPLLASFLSVYEKTLSGINPDFRPENFTAKKKNQSALRRMLRNIIHR